MNNSKLAIDSVPLQEEDKKDITPLLKAEEAKIVKILEAVDLIEKTKEWSTLKTHIFDGLVVALEKQLREEAQKESPDTGKLNRLAGQLKWAEKFADLGKLSQAFRQQLARIRTQLGNKPPDGAGKSS